MNFSSGIFFYSRLLHNKAPLCNNIASSFAVLPVGFHIITLIKLGNIPDQFSIGQFKIKPRHRFKSGDILPHL